MTPIEHAHKQGKVFVNTIPTAMATNMWEVLWKYLNAKEERVPRKPLGPFTTDAAIYNTPPASGLRITWMGHSSLLIEVDGKRILTDPVWGARASFSKYMGPKRFFEAPLPLNQLPKLDAIIISHDHYDHLCMSTIKYLAHKGTPFYCSVGVEKYLMKWGVAKDKITTLNWGDSAMVGDDCKITATPARHFSGRGLHNRNQTLWSSFVIKGHTHNIFYGADSGFFPGFEAIGNAYGPFDLTMLEIGAYNESWADIHMGPIKAAQANLALKGKVMMPIHWGTFNLALHSWHEPIDLLLKEAAQHHITLFAPKPGTPTEVTQEGFNSKWWHR